MLSGYVSIAIALSNFHAKNLDYPKIEEAIGGGGSGGGGAEKIPNCGITNVHYSKRTMSDQESQSLIVTIGNPGTEDCKAEVSIRAANFAVDPTDKVLIADISSKDEGGFVWILSPQKIGTFEVVIDVRVSSGNKSQHQSRTIGISVTDIFGLSPLQTRLLSSFGAFLGPVFTAPWWLEKLKKKKEDEDSIAEEPKPKTQTKRNNKKLDSNSSYEILRAPNESAWLILLIILIITSWSAELLLFEKTTLNFSYLINLNRGQYLSNGSTIYSFILTTSLILTVAALYFFILAWINFFKLSKVEMFIHEIYDEHIKQKLTIGFTQAVLIYWALFTATNLLLAIQRILESILY